MGNNTVGLFLNDFAAEIERAPDLGGLIARQLRSGNGAEIGWQALTMLPCCHADYDQVIIAGGNRINRVALLRGCDHTAEALLHKLADHLGYSLTKRGRR